MNKEYTIHIEQDTDPQNPRIECDQLGTMVCFHKRYGLGDKDTGYRAEDFSSWDELEDAISKEHDPAVLLPIYLYDHSGITINTSGFSCPWDSGRLGLIFAAKRKICDEFGWKRLTKKRLERVETYLRNEVETYDQFLTGDVWGFVIKDEQGEDVESCWGFYGRECCEKEAQDVLKSLMSDYQP